MSDPIRPSDPGTVPGIEPEGEAPAAEQVAEGDVAGATEAGATDATEAEATETEATEATESEATGMPVAEAEAGEADAGDVLGPVAAAEPEFELAPVAVAEAEPEPVPAPAPRAPRGPRPYAVVETGGKQYRVSVGDSISVEKLDGEPGSEVTIERVLLLGGAGAPRVGTPVVAGASVSARIEEQFRGEKIIVFKYKPKKRYRLKMGHRQSLTRLAITAINA